MTKTLAVLIVEDSESDTQLIVRLLKKAGYTITFEQVETAAQMRAALEKQAWEIVISDYSLPEFDGHAALVLLLEMGLDIPFIAVSGTMGEETAVDMMKAGAHDYVMKGNLARLVPAVERELIQAEVRRRRKRAEEALQESERHFRNLADNSPDVIYVLDLVEHRLVFFNRLEFCGYSRQELETSNSILTAVHPDEQNAVSTHWQSILTGDPAEASVIEYRLRCKDGDWEWIQSRETILESDNRDRPTQMLVTLTLITERKQAEQKLHEYSEHLEEMVTERTRELRETQEQLVLKEKLAVLGQIAGSVAHELRNPLGVILNAIYYLKLVQPDANEKVCEFHGIIEQEAHKANKISTDLLDFTRITSADREPVSVPELVQRVLERHPAPLSMEVTLKLSTNLPKVYVDSLQMEQVLGNLVVNAYQAMSNGGKLTITTHRRKEMVAIAVKDTGVGIPPENMHKLFEPLFSTKITGIGLGLAISKKLIEANDGRIEVESEPGKGSAFTVTLPVHNK